MEVEKTFYLIGGPNGSGKTTLIKRIVQDGIEILDMDSIAASKNVSNITAARQLLMKICPVFYHRGIRLCWNLRYLEPMIRVS